MAPILRIVEKTYKFKKSMTNDNLDPIFDFKGTVLKNSQITMIEEIAEFIPGGFFIYYAEGKQELIYANKTVWRIFGCESLEEFKRLTGYTFKGMLHPDDYQAMEESIHKQIATSEESLDHLEFRIIKKDGSIAWITDFGRKAYTEDGPVFFVFIEDITSVAKAAENKMLKDALEEAEKANNAKARFISNMSHDMRTPLNGILGMSEVALENLDDKEKVKGSLESIKYSGQHLLTLVNNSLDIAKFDKGEIQIVNKAVDLLQELQNIKQVFGPIVNVKKQFFSVDASEISHPHVCIDESRINQVLMNLLTNASKYSPEKANIILKVHQDEPVENYVKTTFTVIDNGNGMSEDFIDKLFRPFEREDEKRVTSEQGSGLGLMVTKLIVEKMGGEIFVTSKKGQGSSFSVVINLLIADEQTRIKCVLQDRKVILAEDQFINQEIMKELLASMGAEVDVANNGLEAYELFKNSSFNEYSAIFMDLRMPIMDGFEASSKIRELERGDAKDIPIIAITADTFKDDKEKGAEVGMNAHLPKPVDIDLIVSTVAKLLRQK